MFGFLQAFLRHLVRRRTVHFTVLILASFQLNNHFSHHTVLKHHKHCIVSFRLTWLLHNLARHHLFYVSYKVDFSEHAITNDVHYVILLQIQSSTIVSCSSSRSSSSLVWLIRFCDVSGFSNFNQLFHKNTCFKNL